MPGSNRRKTSSAFDVFQEPQANSDDFRLLQTLQEYNHDANKSALGQVVDTSLILNPPQPQVSCSPTKNPSPISSPVPNVDSSFFDSVEMAAPQQSFSTDSPSKGNVFAPYFQDLAPKPKKALFSTFQTSSKSGNHKRNQSSGDMRAPSQETSFKYTPIINTSHKRQHTEPTFIRDKAVNKKRVVEEEPVGPIPEPEDMPAVVDEGGKPPFSYAQLIGMAIMRAPGRKMTLAQIYKWINDSFEHYRNAGTGWQNSIRHNLSLNKAFQKTERPKDDPGKGHYWTIVEEQQVVFVRDRPQRRPVTADSHAYASNDASNANGQQLLQPMSASSFALPPKPPRAAVDSSRFPNDNENELSSDATVADIGEQDGDARPMPKMRSPEAGDIHSSPPVVRQWNVEHTPSFRQNRSGEHKKRKHDAFRDSGFFSSIESSVHRQQHPAPLYLTSDMDPRSSVLKKRGRAEDEIARIRSSSFDHSPSEVSTKRPRLSKNALPASAILSSSPARPAPALQPLTPGITFKKPLEKPVPSASPGTMLQLHRANVRDLVGTPGNQFATKAVPDFDMSIFNVRDGSPWCIKSGNMSGCILLDEEFAAHYEESPVRFGPVHSLDGAFPEDEPDAWDSYNATYRTGSPVPKKERPNLARAHTASGALGDITNSARGNVRLASPLRFTAKGDNGRSVSPVKRNAKQDSPLKADAFFGFGQSSDSENDDPFQVKNGSKGVDLLNAGFRTIGAPVGKENQPVAPPMKKQNTKTTIGARPPLGRTVTNAF